MLWHIIIITNEKIKVMLSRKRCNCRGTLQDYNKGEISKCQSKLWTNRNVFSWCLNGTREVTVRRDGGRLKQNGEYYNYPVIQIFITHNNGVR